MPEQSAGNHVRHQLLEVFPAVPLVMKAFHHGLPLEPPSVAVFAHRIFKGELRVRQNLLTARGVLFCAPVSARIVLRGSAVELESVRPEIPDKPVKLFLEPGASIGVREVEQRRIAVPPARRRRGLAVRVQEESAPRRISLDVIGIATPCDSAEGRRIHAYPRTHPEDDLVPHCVKLVHHPLGIAEAGRVEPPVAISGLPGVVYHQDTGRQTVIQHRLRVVEDVLLVLVIRKFNPCVVLRCGEEQQVRRLTVGREPCAGRMPERIAKRLARMAHDGL